MRQVSGQIIFVFLSLSVRAQSSYSLPNFAGEDSLQIKEWLKQSEASRIKNADNAIHWAQKALSLSEKINYRSGIAHSYTELGNSFLLKKDYTTSLDYYRDAQPVLRETGNDYLLGQVLKNCGDIYSARSYYRQAFDSYRDATVLLRKTSQQKLLNECQEAMGNLALEFGQARNAANIYRRSLTVKINLNDTKGIIATTSKLSKIYLSLKQYDSALYFNKEVQRLSKEDKETLTDATIDEMIILSFQDKLNEAAEIKLMADKLVKQQNNPSNNMKLLAATSNFYMAQKDKILSAKYFDSAKAMIQEARSPELAVTGLSMLAEMSRQNDDYRTAYEMIRQMDKYKDIFRNENMERISAEIKNTSEASLKEKEIEYLNKENNLKADKLKKETLLRLALLRQNLLIDSSLEQQRLLIEAKESEAMLRNEQLNKEKELSLSLIRENELKQQLLNDERNNKRMLWTGIGALAILVSIIFIQYRKQLNKNSIINKQSGELEVLNKEIHHRVKNNLQVISSMLDLQSQSLNDPQATGIIKEGIQRVQSMAFIHQNLYQGNAVNSVNMTEYIKMLSNHLFQSYNIRPEKIQLHTNIQDLNLHTDTAIPLGMILNELISNSLKYAFKEKEEGDIWVTMKRNNGELLLQVKDNGVGLKNGFNPENTSTFGYEIINAFAQKLKARINIDGSNGTDVQLIISKFKTAG
jgi:two-component system, sensor histidine kinase PdtaS